MGFFDKFKKAAPPPPPREKSLLEEQLSPLYPPLVRQIAAMIPVDWEILWFLGEVEPGKASYSNVFYIREAGSGRIVRSNDFSRVYGVPNAAYVDQWSKLNDQMLAIWQCFPDNGHKPWEQLSMSLERTGKFNIHFNYDTVHAKSDGQPSREVLWAYQTFGYLPEEGSWMRKLLDEQLQQESNAAPEHIFALSEEHRDKGEYFMASSFIDKARITVCAGNGGNGVVSFHREKYVAAGGPDGGDGGRGGSIILQVDDHMSTLMDFRYKRKYVASSGADGQGKRKFGRDGEDLVIRVPRGTLVRDAETGEIIVDMSTSEPFTLCRGGRGGWGNSHFATPTRQVPRFAKAGLPGESHDVILELKLLADVGLVGFPNVGKSTLLSVVSKAQPKIANYHFTTLFPNLGVVWVEDGVSFVMADIPGIIEGASQGAGLGHDFLRHIDRCRLLVHVVDVSGSEGRDPVADFDAINAELREYSPALAERPQIVCANKVDIMENPENLQRLRERVEAAGCTLLELSAAAHQGTRELVNKAAEMLSVLPPVTVYEPEYVPRPPAVDTSAPLDIRHEDDLWIIEGPWLQRLMGNVNFADYESRMWFDKILRESGLFQRLEEMGIRDGDTVSLYDWEFEYQR